MPHFLNKERLNGLFRYAMALTAEKQDAEDLLQTGIERALKGDFASIENKSAYIRTIMRNAWYDELRKQKIRQTSLYSELDHDAFLNTQTEDTNDQVPVSLIEVDPSNIIISEIELQKAWIKLGDQQREILYLWCVLGMTAAEMAQELKLSRGTVLSKIHRLKLFLRQQPQHVQQDNKGAK